MMLTAFGQLQETATVIFFIKHGQPQPLRERTRRETLYSFLNEVHDQTICASFIFTDLVLFFLQITASSAPNGKRDGVF